MYFFPSICFSFLQELRCSAFLSHHVDIFIYLKDSNDLFYLAFPQNYLPKTQMDIYIAGAFFREGEEINYLSNKYLLTRFCGLTWLSH